MHYIGPHSLFRAALLLCAFWMAPLATAWIVPQPQQNVWVTLAKTLQQEHFCLSTAAVGSPFSTCLVGVPLSPSEYPKPKRGPPLNNPLRQWDRWARTLKEAKDEPQEFDLLGSAPSPYCIWFNYKGYQDPHILEPHDKRYTSSSWCNLTEETFSASSEKPKIIEKGMFLICGDRAWAGIPSRVRGGPCTLGKLSLLAPNKTQILNWKKEAEETPMVRRKRGIENYDSNCDSEVYHWSHLKRSAVSVFLPWVAAAKAMAELGTVECWIAKQANLTSSALSELLADEEVTRKATLQNHAAIDFLLLAHGHGCQEFEGMCCFNLSSHSESIHATIQKMRDQLKSLKRETDDWLDSVFGNWGLSGWASSILKSVLWIFVIIFVILLMFSCLKTFLIKSVGSSFGLGEPKTIAAVNASSTRKKAWWVRSDRETAL